MTDLILNFFKDLSGGQVILVTIIVAMIPIIELKGAIPFAASTQIWGETALSVWESFLWAYLGTSIIAVILILSFNFIIKLLFKLKITQKIATSVYNKVYRHSKEINESSAKKKNTRLLKALGVGTFVAVPLPLTGIWTGSCIAAFLKMPLLDSILSILIGNFICGIIITFLSKTFEAYTHIILIAVLVLAVVLITSSIIISKIKNKNKDKLTTEEIMQNLNMDSTPKDSESQESE